MEGGEGCASLRGQPLRGLRGAKGGEEHGLASFVLLSPLSPFGEATRLQRSAPLERNDTPFGEY